MRERVAVKVFGFYVSVTKYSWSRWRVYRNAYGIWLELGRFQVRVARPSRVQLEDYL